MKLEDLVFNIRKAIIGTKVDITRAKYLLGLINDQECEDKQKENVYEMIELLVRKYGESKLKEMGIIE